MPRTVEHIVECHRAASALRAENKPIWRKKIDIRSILREDQSNEAPEHIAAISVRIAKLFRSRLPATFFDYGHDDFDDDFLDVIEAMESCTIAELAQDAKNGVEPISMFNGWLETVYDWADVNRVWLGPK